MIIFSDLHLREATEDVCFRVLEEIGLLALADDKRVVCCGDFWHIRYQLNVRLLNRVAALLSSWQTKGINLIMVPGNHDQVDVAGTNALEIFDAFINVSVASEPLLVGEYGFVPYRKDPTAQVEALDRVSDALTIFSHFAVGGSLMNNGTKDREGITPVTSARLVLGHYHKHQIGPGWMYVGSPYQTSFGDSGNACGCIDIRPSGDAVFVPIDVGAPAHYIIEWDPSESDAPPNHPGAPHDHVRLDVKASREMIVKGKFKGVLKRQGLDSAQVNVIPVDVVREHRFELARGESLIQAADRFARERLIGGHGDSENFDQEADEVMAALLGWAK